MRMRTHQLFQEVSEDEALFYASLKSLELALTTVAVSPVVLPTDIPDARFSRIFYDAEENEEKALEIMDKRIHKFRGAITTHLGYFRSFVSDFYNIAEHLNAQRRDSVYGNVSDLIERVSDYCLFVGKELSSNHGDSFFEFPHTIPGHYDRQLLFELKFNPQQTEAGALDDLAALRTASDIFARATGILVYSGIGDTDTGRGYDGSLRGNTEVTLELLRRAGF